MADTFVTLGAGHMSWKSDGPLQHRRPHLWPRLISLSPPHHKAAVPLKLSFGMVGVQVRARIATDDELRQDIVDLVGLGFGPAVVEICATLHLDGEWIETLALDEMINLRGVSPLAARLPNADLPMVAYGSGPELGIVPETRPWATPPTQQTFRTSARGGERKFTLQRKIRALGFPEGAACKSAPPQSPRHRGLALVRLHRSSRPN